MLIFPKEKRLFIFGAFLALTLTLIPYMLMTLLQFSQDKMLQGFFLSWNYLLFFAPGLAFGVLIVLVMNSLAVETDYEHPGLLFVVLSTCLYGLAVFCSFRQGALSLTLSVVSSSGVSLIVLLLWMKLYRMGKPRPSMMIVAIAIGLVSGAGASTILASSGEYFSLIYLLIFLWQVSFSFLLNHIYNISSQKRMSRNWSRTGARD